MLIASPPLPAAVRAGASLRIRSALCLAAVIAVGAVLRFAWIGRAGVWENELFSVFWAQRPLVFLWPAGARLEADPPLSFTLLKAWMAWFGTAPATVRALGAVASTATVGLMPTGVDDNSSIIRAGWYRARGWVGRPSAIQRLIRSGADPLMGQHQVRLASHALRRRLLWPPNTAPPRHAPSG